MAGTGTLARALARAVTGAGTAAVAIEPVVVVAAPKVVVADTAVQPVIAAAAQDQIVTPAAVQLVLAAIAFNGGRLDHIGMDLRLVIVLAQHDAD